MRRVKKEFTMGLDSVVKKQLRDHTKAFVYRNTLEDVYKIGFESIIVDMNVELFRVQLTFLFMVCIANCRRLTYTQTETSYLHYRSSVGALRVQRPHQEESRQGRCALV